MPGTPTAAPQDPDYVFEFYPPTKAVCFRRADMDEPSVLDALLTFLGICFRAQVRPKDIHYVLSEAPAHWRYIVLTPNFRPSGGVDLQVSSSDREPGKTQAAIPSSGA